MTPELRQDFEHWADTGRISAITQRKLLNEGLIEVDRYGSLILTDKGSGTLHFIRKGKA